MADPGHERYQVGLDTGSYYPGNHGNAKHTSSYRQRRRSKLYALPIERLRQKTPKCNKYKGYRKDCNDSKRREAKSIFLPVSHLWNWSVKDPSWQGQRVVDKPNWRYRRWMTVWSWRLFSCCSSKDRIFRSCGSHGHILHSIFGIRRVIESRFLHLLLVKRLPQFISPPVKNSSRRCDHQQYQAKVCPS